MKPRTNAVGNPPFRALEYAVIVATTLILAGVLGLLSIDLFPLASGSPDAAKCEQGKSAVEKTYAALPQVRSTAHAARPGIGTRSPREVSQDEAQEPPARVAVASMQLPPSTIILTPTTVGQIILMVALIFALAITAALIFSSCFFAMLRRYSREFGALINIEYAAAAQPIVVNPYPAFAGGMAAPPLAPSRDGAGRDGALSDDAVAAHTAKATDFGGSIDGVRQRMDAEAKQQQDAVLQRLFEDNLKLQAEIGDAQGKQGSATLDEADLA